MTRFPWRVPAALAASALAGVAIAAASANPAPPGEARASAQALVAATTVKSGGGEALPPAAARAAADARLASIPLPPGGTLNGIQWGVDGGAWEPSTIEVIVEYNAACQWLRAWRDGRDADTALDVLSTAAEWPAMRGTESGEWLTKVAADARAGGGQAAANMLADCDQSHAREVATARRQGLTPSS